MQQRNPSRPRGAAAVLAMLFLVLLTTLTVAMFGMATANVQTASNLSDVARAQGAAESGLRWMAHRFTQMQRPRTLEGVINASVMHTLWPEIRQAIINDMADMVIVSERAWVNDGYTVQSPDIAVETGGSRFSLNIRPTDDPTVLRVTSTGKFREAQRSISMTFKVDKRVKYAIVGKVPVQLGRNTIVEGPIGVRFDNANWLQSKGPPILMLSDFTHFDDQLKARVESWNDFLQGTSVVDGQVVPNHASYDNRINVNNPQEAALAAAAGFSDVNGDAFIDEYDLFVERFDSDHDLVITAAEFTDPLTGDLYEPDLFAAIDSIGEADRYGFRDGQIDNADGYAKLRGHLQVSITAEQWQAELDRPGRNMTKLPFDEIQGYIQGTIATTDPTQIPVRFGVAGDDILDLSPENFEAAAASFKDRSGPSQGPTLRLAGQRIENAVLTASDANGGTTIEETPKGVTAGTHQATYKRPVFRNMTFKNVQVPKGLNALFENCTFEGVTWVEGERKITTSSGATTTSSGEGMNWARQKVTGDNFDKNKPLVGTGLGTITSGTTQTKGSRDGNNLRFDGCTFQGPLAGNYATAYTHFANSWEFTGETMFNNVVDQTATIVAPQVNIEMGSFTDPSGAPSTMIGVVVAGNIDIRGASNVDGCIIVTGDGAGHTTLAYFGPSDSDMNPGTNPEGGYGKLNIRYNPNRALPYGINIPVDITAQTGTYREVR